VAVQSPYAGASGHHVVIYANLWRGRISITYSWCYAWAYQPPPPGQSLHIYRRRGRGFLSFSSVQSLYIAELQRLKYHVTRIPILVERSFARLACGSADTAQMCAARLAPSFQLSARFSLILLCRLLAANRSISLVTELFGT
jgi:hypothetical protein